MSVSANTAYLVKPPLIRGGRSTGSDRVPTKSNPWEGEAVPVPPAPEPACSRKVDRYQSPPGYLPARSSPAARPSPPYERCARCSRPTGQNGRSLPAESAIGRVLSYGSPFYWPRMLRQSLKKGQSFVFKGCQNL